MVLLPVAWRAFGVGTKRAFHTTHNHCDTFPFGHGLCVSAAFSSCLANTTWTCWVEIHICCGLPDNGGRRAFAGTQPPGILLQWHWYLAHFGCGGCAGTAIMVVNRPDLVLGCDSLHATAHCLFPHYPHLHTIHPAQPTLPMHFMATVTFPLFCDCPGQSTSPFYPSSSFPGPAYGHSAGRYTFIVLAANARDHLTVPPRGDTPSVPPWVHPYTTPPFPNANLPSPCLLTHYDFLLLLPVPLVCLDHLWGGSGGVSPPA